MLIVNLELIILKANYQHKNFSNYSSTYWEKIKDISYFHILLPAFQIRKLKKS